MRLITACYCRDRKPNSCAIYLGWLMHRTWGGIVAGTLFILPSLFLLILLSWIYLRFGDVPAVAGLLYGIKPAVTAIVLFAAHRIGSRALKNWLMWVIAALAFSRHLYVTCALPFDCVARGPNRRTRRTHRLRKNSPSAADTARQNTVTARR